MTMLLDERLRDLATQTHLLEEKVNALGWMAGAASIRRWNAMCNGDRQYKLIRESLGGRR